MCTTAIFAGASMPRARSRLSSRPIRASGSREPLHDTARYFMDMEAMSEGEMDLMKQRVSATRLAWAEALIDADTATNMKRKAEYRAAAEALAKTGAPALWN